VTDHPGTGPSRASSGVDRSDRIVRATFARLDILAIAVSTGCLFAVLLWGATAVLLLKGPVGGQEIGPHLGLIANFFPGYTVTWPGSAVGLVYGFLLGLLLGGSVGIFWNLVHHVFLMFVFRRVSAVGLDI